MREGEEVGKGGRRENKGKWKSREVWRGEKR